MKSNAELNELLLNAMFALNEAGDDLDEIYKIGLETAVTLLNANRGCIFERDEWDDDKWTVTKSFNLDAEDANTLEVSRIISSKLHQGDNLLFLSPTTIGYSLKIYKWVYWILYFEGESLQHNFETRASLIKQFFHQLPGRSLVFPS